MQTRPSKVLKGKGGNSYCPLNAPSKILPEDRGLITSTIHVLILVPVFFALMKERALRHGTLQPRAPQSDA